MTKKKRTRKKKVVTVKSFLVHRLRRLSRWWPEKNIARNNAKIVTLVGNHKNGNPKTKVLYQCNICSKLVEKSQGNIDHINPVVGMDGFETWDEFINTLFCNASNLQHLCLPCHSQKSSLEQEERAKRRQAKKELTVGTPFATINQDEPKRSKNVNKKSK